MHSSCRLWIVALVPVIVVIGCGHDQRTAIIPVNKTEVDEPLLDEESRTYHFGAVVSKPGQKLKHRYRLANVTSHDIKIVELVNRKPCCGEVSTAKSMLNPGEETEIEVILSIRQEFGDVVHETVVLTDPPQPEELVLQTMAKAYPAFRVDELTPIDGSSLLSSDKPKLVAFVVFAYGSEGEPPVDLDRVELHSTINVDWVGAKQDRPDADGLRVESRRFCVSLDPAGPSGQRKSEILFQEGGQILYGHVVNWEAASPITAFPKTIVMKPGQRDYRVLIQSRDHKLFRITRIECKVLGVKGRAVNTTDALVQTVEVECEGVPPSESRQGVITVFTDHPTQAKVDLPFVVLN